MEPTFLDVPLVIILNHDENHKETDLKLSRYFKQVLFTTKITNGLKDNLKSLELFEAINENEQIKNTDPFTYKIGEKYYFNVSYF